MSGFLACFSASAAPFQPERIRLFEKAIASIGHRGPDDDVAISSGPGWWMGSRGAQEARQSIRVGKDRWLVFKGEIYNLKALRAQFDPAQFHSTDGSEVLGKLLSEFGVDVTIRQLRGMFAFAFWDERQGEVVFARDSFGIKPLYFARMPDGSLLLSSEVAALRSSGRPGQVSTDGIAGYFRSGGPAAPGTMFTGVQLLPPGMIARWSGGEVKILSYFRPMWLDRYAWLPEGEPMLRETRNRVTESVRVHLPDDASAGVFLDGRLESNIVAACVRQLGGTFKAISVVYEGEKGADAESAAAISRASFYGADCVAERVSATSLHETFDDFIRDLDAPSADAIDVYLFSRAARDVKVALSGVGADEWFGGHDYFTLSNIARSFPLWRSMETLGLGDSIRKFFEDLPGAVREMRLCKIAALMLGAEGGTMAEWHRSFRAVFSEDELNALLCWKLDRSLDIQASDWPEIERDLEFRAPDSWINVLSLLETEHHLPNVVLRDCDRIGAAHSLELRTPFVDREIFQLAGQVPQMKLRGGIGKRVLWEAFRSQLSPSIQHDSREKSPGPPFEKWLRDPVWRDRIYDTLLSKRCAERGWLELSQVRHYLRKFYDATETGSARGFSRRIWLMLVLESWAQSHLDPVSP